jgi:hypothetical protein
MRGELTAAAGSTPPRMTWPMVATASAAYAAIAVLLTFPLVLRLSSVVPVDLGDPLLSAAILWWNAHVLPFTQQWWDGFAFYPASGFMALSDHRLGESLLATPLQWLGCNPITAYNLTVLATFPLCAISAHWLGFVVARRHDAATICGLSFGFSPYRVAHLQHLELLGAFGMPAALAALHRYMETRRRRWLVVFGGALVLQGLAASYYLLFFSVFLALWLWWFLRGRDARQLLAIALAGACALVALLPIAIGYTRIHAYYGLKRHLNEIVDLSADLTSLFAASPRLALWGWMAPAGRHPESALFPGLTIAALAFSGVVLAWRRPAGARDRFVRLPAALLTAAGVLAAIAFCGWWFAPWRLEFAGVRMSSDAPFKPLTLAVMATLVSLAFTSRARTAYACRSMFAFYLLATSVLLVCSLGPKPMLLGHQVLYEPPYSWLMRLQAFSAVRVPARFAMPAMLALAASGALAFNRFRLEGRSRRALAIALMAGILADTWMRDLPLPALPDSWPPARADGFVAVLELPIGGTFADLAATYRVTGHGHPIVNGNSGFEPPHYFTVRTAFEERDPTALDGLRGSGPMLIVIARRDDPDGGWAAYLHAHPRVTPLAPDERWLYFSAAPPPAPPAICSGDSLPIVAATSNGQPIDLAVLRDNNPDTWWTAPRPQRVGDSIVVDFGSEARPCAVFVSMGQFGRSYPRQLIVDTSQDAVQWNTVATRRTAGLTMQAALDDPKRVAFPVPLESSSGRYLRLRLDEAHGTVPWTVTDLAVRTARGQQ